MIDTQVIATAKAMFLNGSGRGDVMDFLLENGVPADEVNEVAAAAYAEIKDERQQQISLNEEVQSKETSKGVFFGVVLLVGGIIASYFTGRIWYGAMIVGGIMIVKGLVK